MSKTSESIPRIFTFQNVVTGSRSANTAFQNLTGKPMLVVVQTNLGASEARTDSSNPPTTAVASLTNGLATQISTSLCFIVLPRNFYLVTQGFASWTEYT